MRTVVLCWYIVYGANGYVVGRNLLEAADVSLASEVGPLEGDLFQPYENDDSIPVYYAATELHLSCFDRVLRDSFYPANQPIANV